MAAFNSGETEAVASAISLSLTFKASTEVKTYVVIAGLQIQNSLVALYPDIFKGGSYACIYVGIAFSGP